MKLSYKEASFWHILIKEVSLTKDLISNTGTSNSTDHKLISSKLPWFQYKILFWTEMEYCKVDHVLT